MLIKGEALNYTGSHLNSGGRCCHYIVLVWRIYIYKGNQEKTAHCIGSINCQQPDGLVPLVVHFSFPDCNRAEVFFVVVVAVDVVPERRVWSLYKACIKWLALYIYKDWYSDSPQAIRLSSKYTCSAGWYYILNVEKRGWIKIVHLFCLARVEMSTHTKPMIKTGLGRHCKIPWSITLELDEVLPG